MLITFLHLKEKDWNKRFGIREGYREMMRAKLRGELRSNVEGQTNVLLDLLRRIKKY